MFVFNTLAPVFLLIAIGAVLQRTGFASPGFLKEANRLTYWLGLPALLFSELANSFHGASGGQTRVGWARGGDRRDRGRRPGRDTAQPLRRVPPGAQRIRS